MKKIILFVEGEGEAVAAPLLVNKLLNEIPNARQTVSIDPKPFRVGQINKLLSKDNWRKKSLAALKQKGVAGILVLLDGDIKKVDGELFCPAKVATTLAKSAADFGAGETFSVAVVFAVREFESWLIASFDSIKGRKFPDGREVASEATLPDDVEVSPRDAKKWFGKRIDGGYRPTRDQATLTKWIEPALLREKKVRSFKRLEAAVEKLVEGIENGTHSATPNLST